MTTREQRSQAVPACIRDPTGCWISSPACCELTVAFDEENEASDVDGTRAVLATGLTSPERRTTADQAAPPPSQDPQGPATNNRQTVRSNLGRENPLPIIPTQQNLRTGRIRWTKEKNLKLMYVYYTVTKNETDMILYRRKLLEKWRELEPTCQRTEQNLASQINSILRRSALSQAELTNLKEQVRVETEAQPQGDQQENEAAPENTQNAVPIEHNQAEQQRVENNPAQPTANVAPTEELDLFLDAKYKKFKMEYEYVTIEKRARLPKLTPNNDMMKVVKKVNYILAQDTSENMEIDDILHKIYCGAATVCLETGIKIKEITPSHRPKHQRSTPPWQRRIEYKIVDTRKKIGVLTNYLDTKHRSSKKVIDKARIIIQKANIKLQDPNHKAQIKLFTDQLKQKVAVLGAKIRRYNESNKRKEQTKQYENNQRAFFQSLNRETIEGPPPSKSEMENFWKNIWSDNTKHEHAPWMDEIRGTTQHIRPMENFKINIEDIKKSIKTTPNWKAPGPDNIHNFWIKHFTSLHRNIAEIFQKYLTEPHRFPQKFCGGRTVMIPKSKSTQDPKEYRPITCLPNLYKLFTKILCEKVTIHIETNDILAIEQNGCRRGAKGTKDILVIDNVIGKMAQRKNRNLSMAWIDYRKAFDSVPHSWLIQVMEIYKVNDQVTSLLKILMQHWHTQLVVNTPEKSYETEKISIQRGIFQGDSLSPVWFCLALNPLSTLLKQTNFGFTLTKRPQRSIEHAVYMDDLKLYSKSEQHLQSLLEIVASFSRSIKMEFGLKKCATVHYKKGKISKIPDIKLMDETEIATLKEPAYKYLGMLQSGCIHDTEMRQNVKEQYYKRIKKVGKTYLPAKYKIQAINTWAAPLLSYTYGILKWTKTDLQEIDTHTRKILTKCRLHHPSASTGRMYLPRHYGGRGLMSIERACKKEINKLKEYFHDRNTPLHVAIKEIDEGYSPLNLSSNEDHEEPVTLQESIDHLKQKQLIGRYMNALDSDQVSKKHSLTYLTSIKLTGETEGFMCSIQDQVVKTRAYLKYITGTDIDPTCRMCKSTAETIQHISSGCSILAPTLYTERHNNIAKIVYLELCYKYKLKSHKADYYTFNPEPLKENEQVKLYWDVQLSTNRTITHNKPDIALIHKKDKQCFIIDVAVPLDHNIQKAVAEKIQKYQDLSYELKRIYHLKKIKILPFVISANGLVELNLEKHLEELGLETRIIPECVKAAVLGTVRAVRRALNITN